MYDNSVNPDELYDHFKSHFFWRDRALGLRHAAESLLEQLRRVAFPENGEDDDARLRREGLENSFTLLTGLAMENLIKAVHVKQKTSQSIGLKWKNGHDQVELAKDIMPLSEVERELLASLSVFVLWAGRYPVPKSSTILLRKRRGPQNRKSKAWFPEALSESEYKAVRALFDKLECILMPKLKKIGSRLIGESNLPPSS